MFFIIFISKKLALTASFLYYFYEVNKMTILQQFLYEVFKQPQSADWASAIGTVAAVIVSMYFSFKNERKNKQNEIDSFLPYFVFDDYKLYYDRDEGTISLDELKKAHIHFSFKSIEGNLPVIDFKLIPEFKFKESTEDEQKPNFSKLITRTSILPGTYVEPVDLPDYNYELMTLPSERNYPRTIYVDKIYVSCKTVKGTDIFVDYDFSEGVLQYRKDKRKIYSGKVNHHTKKKIKDDMKEFKKLST